MGGGAQGFLEEVRSGLAPGAGLAGEWRRCVRQREDRPGLSLGTCEGREWKSSSS